MLTENQASIILDILDIATQGNWMDISEELEERGFNPENVIDAWKALEKMVGRSNTCPELGDF